MGTIRFVFAVMVLASVEMAAGAALAVEQRIALIIGNSAYATAPLANPVNDARLMSRVLREHGFDVIERLDVGQNDMKRAVKDFGNRLKAAQGEAIGLFYYAGHGLQVRGENFLIPIDAEIEGEGDVDIYAISADAVLRTIEDARNGLNIVDLDACRNNPYVRGFRDASRGLALMEAPTGTLIAYSTAPGQVAIDGSGANSPYTEALARALAMPGVPIEQMFKSVRNDVLAATQGRQTPWEASSLTGADYYLVAAPPAVVEPQPVPAPAPAPIFDHAAMELAFWEAIQDSDDPRRFEQGGAASGPAGGSRFAEGFDKGYEAGLTDGAGQAELPEAAQIQMEEISYALGYFLGEEVRAGIEHDAVEADLEAVVRGFRDGLFDNLPRLPRSVIEEMLAKMENDVEARLVEGLRARDPRFTALAEQSLQRSREFHDEFARREGVVTLPNGIQYQVLAQVTFFEYMHYDDCFLLAQRSTHWDLLGTELWNNCNRSVRTPDRV